MTWTPAMEAELKMLLHRAVRRDARNSEAAIAACKGKPAFATSQLAIESMPKRNQGGRITPYRCKHCNRWHLGSHLSTAARERKPRTGHGESYLCACGHSFPFALGKYGCPNCCGESGAARRGG